VYQVGYLLHDQEFIFRKMAVYAVMVRYVVTYISIRLFILMQVKLSNHKYT